MNSIHVGEWVVLPFKTRPAVSFAEVTGAYEFEPKADDPCFHSRTVKWLTTDVPRSAFGQDLLYSFGAFMTICRIERNDAESRVKAMSWCEAMVSGNLPLRLMSDTRCDSLPQPTTL